MSAKAARVGAVSLVLVACSAVLAAQGADRPVFEVASVKQNKTDGVQRIAFGPGDRVNIANVPLRTIVQAAYEVNAPNLVGVPSWMMDERFDITAKAAAAASPVTLRLMVRALLADRFKLVVHTETRVEQTFSLVLARSDGKLGPNLHPAAVDCATLRAGRDPRDNPCGLATGPFGPANVRGLPLGQLIGLIRQDAGRRVVDKTGLSGNFDWDLTWTRQAFLQAPFDRARFPTVDPDGPSIFVALEEQLGLKLEPSKEEGTFLVIDRVEHLEPN